MRGWSRAVLWSLLALPLLIQTSRYQSGTVFYGEYLHWTGDWSIWLFLLVLLITPLRRILPGHAWTARLLRARRDLGIATFLYAVAHTVAYGLRKADMGRILMEALDSGMLAGWLALVGMLALALTSNDWSVRRLAGSWKALHRLAYAIALLAVGHWVLTAFDPTVAYLHLAVIAVLLLLRLLPVHGRAAG